MARSIICAVVLAVIVAIAHAGVPHTVSGLSSGAFAAVQYHVAYSSSVNGAGIVAGGPYWCAMDNVEVALNACMSSPSYISLSALYAATAYAEAALSIDSTSNLANDRVYLFSGTLDTVVDPGVMEKLLGYYEHYILSSTAIKYNFNISAVHGMITDDYGNPCSDFGSPFINNCNFDLVGEMFNHIFPYALNPRVTPNTSNVITLNQGNFVPVTHDPSDFSLYQNAYAYIPTNCQPQNSKDDALSKGNNSSVMCAVHVAFHGCEQTVPDIGLTYVLNAGYNQWAESNSIIILYPQALRTTMNPKGCFDWWGYTGPDYATKLAVQNIVVNGMVDWLFTTYN